MQLPRAQSPLASNDDETAQGGVEQDGTLGMPFWRTYSLQELQRACFVSSNDRLLYQRRSRQNLQGAGLAQYPS